MSEYNHTEHRSRGPVLPLQHCTFHLGSDVILLASEYDSWELLRPDLFDSLPYNSETTKRTLGAELARWALDQRNFPSLAVQVWRSYSDPVLLQDILRERYLKANPISGAFVTRVLNNIPSGSPLPIDALQSHLAAENVQEKAIPKGIERLRATMRQLGFLLTNRRKPHVVLETTLPETAFLLLLHYYFAQEVTTVPVHAILAHPFWRYLGGREESQVRAYLERATANDVLARYAVVDQLDQITTRFSFEEFLNHRVQP